MNGWVCFFYQSNCYHISQKRSGIIICQDFYLRWTRKDIEQLPNFFLRLWVEMLNVLYILEALRHNNMPGLLPGWTRKDIEQLPNFFLRLRVEMLNVLYILEALRHNNMPGLLPGWTRKDIEQLPSFLFFFTSTGRNAKRVIYPRSAQA